MFWRPAPPTLVVVGVIAADDLILLHLYVQIVAFKYPKVPLVDLVDGPASCIQLEIFEN